MKFQIVQVNEPTFADENNDGIDDVTGEEVEPEENDIEDFHSMLVLEGVWTGDGRYIDENALTWRSLPLPLMGLDKTTDAHMEARLIGNITRIEREGREVHGYGTFVKSDDDEVLRLQRLIKDGALRGVSVDLDAMEYEVVIPASMTSPEELPEPDENGESSMPVEDLKMRVTAARIMGATVVPFPAFEEAYIESQAALTASLNLLQRTSGYILPIADINDFDSVVAAGHPIDAPVCPPHGWFKDPQLSAPTPMTVTNEGRLYGHIATWGSCHIGFSDQCVTPPKSTANYQHYLTGEILCAEGTRIPVGQITMDTGHAPLNANGSRALAHYDNTGTAVADVTTGEDAHGIWMAGAIRPGLDPIKIRGLMASDVSGDWRRIGGNLELVGVLAVNVPGFPKARVRVHEYEGLVASLIASMPAEQDKPAQPDLRKVVDRLAKSIGRSADERKKEIVKRVKGDN